MQEHCGSAISPKHPVGKRPIRVRVLLLDGHLENFILSPRCPGQEFFDLVVQSLQVEDTDYFDLEYEDAMGNKCWLDHFKPIHKPVSQMLRKPAQFSFKVKFYTTHLNLLINKLTRRLFALQVKKDLIDGELNCGENTAALLTAFVLQAELGDREEEDRRILSYLENIRLSKQYSPAFISKVVDLHSNLEGMSEGEADYRLLDAARKLEFYGLKLHPARHLLAFQENGGIPLNLGVTHAGLFLYQGKNKLNHFSWSKIRKLSFKRTRFLIKLHSGMEPFGKDTIEFTFESRDACKNFWKKCLEHHAFFRSREVRGEPGAGGGGLGGFGSGIWSSAAPPAHPYASQPSLRFAEDVGHKNSSGGGGLTRSVSLKSGRSQGLFSKGSSYRYCGRTQQQLIENSYNSSPGIMSSEKRSKSVGRLGSGQNLSRFGSPHLHRSVAHVNEKPGEDLPRMLQHQQCLFRGSSSSTVAADFGPPTTSLPDHYQLLFLSTPIRRPLSTRYRAGSSHSVDQSSLPTESPCKVGPQLLESEYGASVPRVFSASVLKASKRRRESDSLTNTSPAVTTVTTKPSDAESITKYSLLTSSRPSITSGLTAGSVPWALDEKCVEKATKDSIDEKHVDKRSKVLTPTDASSSEEPVSVPLSSNGVRTSAPSTAIHDLHTSGQRARTFSAYEEHSQYSNSLPPEHYDEVAEDEDDIYDNDDTNVDRADLSDDSLLQHPLSVCASRAVSSSDLYRSESIEFQYPVCKLDDQNSPLDQELENGKKITEFPIFSPYAQESPPDKVESRGSLFYPSKSAPASRRTSNYSTHDEEFGEEEGIEPSSIAPALSIGAISAITGVSCSDDEADESGGGGGEGINTCESRDEGKTEAMSLMSGPSSPPVNTLSSLVGQRAQSEPLQPVSSVTDGLHVEIDSHASNQARRQRLRGRRTRKRELRGGLDYLAYDALTATVQQHASTVTANPTSRTLRKKSLPPYHDRTFQLARELSVTEKTYINALRLLIMPYHGNFIPDGNLHTEVTRLITPLHCHHSALLQSALTRVAAWEKAAISAATARTRFQSALAGVHRAQRTRRKRAARQIQAGRQHKSKCSQKLAKGDGCGNDLGTNELSDSSTSVSGVPRSSSRNELPPSETNRNRTPPAEGCNLTASSSSCSSFSSSSTSSNVESSYQSVASPPDLASAERELRETTRCLAEMARIADVYRHPLLDGIVSRYEGFLTALPELLSKHIPRYMENESSDCVAGYPSRLALLRVPARRLWYYTQAFRRLAELYGDEHPDLDDCNALVSQLSDLVSRFDSVYRTTEAYALVAEFCQDYQLDAVERPNVHDRCRRRECSIAVLSSLVNEPHSRLIRVGFLEKMSSRGRGFQPRMALLFTDRLVYCGRVSGSTNMQLKIHGVVSLYNAGLESHIKTSVSFSEGISQEGTATSRNSSRERHSFAILVFSGERAEKASSTTKSIHSRTHQIIFAAPNEEQKRLWLMALNKVLGRDREDERKLYRCSSMAPTPSLHGISKSDRPSTEDKSQLISKARETQDMQSHVALNSKDNYLGLLGPRSHLQQTVLRCSGLAYVCWHRRLSVSLDNVLNANKCEISGYLLRKFKTSCGWQKLWTVFTDFTLFFYKSPEDSTPIASLPLLGYRLESARPAAAAADAQFHKSDVLQLTYKSHAYYFRTDAPVSFERWHSALSSALNPLSSEKK
ncbi:putative ferm, rhogef and pleckstrin domain-containing protein [Echinococcus granulosus]|nr:putative ferm, rhogef and pleckstrin domain-containing protein [Echinococcus granulosus]